jgi:hypothetical protein
VRSLAVVVVAVDAEDAFEVTAVEDQQPPAWVTQPGANEAASVA